MEEEYVQIGNKFIFEDDYDVVYVIIDVCKTRRLIRWSWVDEFGDTVCYDENFHFGGVSYSIDNLLNMIHQGNCELVLNGFRVKKNKLPKIKL